MALDPADLPLLSRLLDQALDLPEDQIEAWLAALPPEHAHLAPRLLEMLASRLSSGGGAFLAGAPQLTPADESVARPDERVGPYRLLREIGRGGMAWCRQGVSECNGSASRWKGDNGLLSSFCCGQTPGRLCLSAPRVAKSDLSLRTESSAGNGHVLVVPNASGCLQPPTRRPRSARAPLEARSMAQLAPGPSSHRTMTSYAGLSMMCERASLFLLTLRQACPVQWRCRVWTSESNRALTSPNRLQPRRITMRKSKLPKLWLLSLATLAAAAAVALAQPAAACGVPLAVQATAGPGFKAVLLADGSVWLANGSDEAIAHRFVRVPLLQGIVQLAADGSRLYARQSDGRVWSWQPGAPAMPRPVLGLPGKATLLTAGDDGRLAVLVRRSAFAATAGPVAEQQVELYLDGQIAAAKRVLPPHYASNDNASRIAPCPVLHLGCV